MTIDPSIPDDWPGYSITFRYGQTEYQIEVKNGVERSDNEIHLVDDRQSHNIRIGLGRPGKSVQSEEVEATSIDSSDVPAT